jgi:hypothetical protein
MKRILAYAVVTLTLVAAGVLVSAQLDLTTFTPNTPILAEEVNGNFEALADSLSTKQTRVTDGCVVGSAIRTINADGTVECEPSGGAGGEFYTKEEIDALLAALTSDNVVDESLRLSDLGGQGPFTTVTSFDIVLGPGECKAQLAGNFGAAVIGSLVVGTLADADGDPVLSNTAAFIPSIVIGTTQGGAVPNLVTCNTGGGTLTIPAGSVFTWRMISP